VGLWMLVTRGCVTAHSYQTLWYAAQRHMLMQRGSPAGQYTGSFRGK